MSRLDTATEATPISSSAPRRSWGEWIAWIATEDHCEWANQYVAWFRTPLGVLSLGAVSALMCGLFVAPQGYLLLAAIAAIVGVGLAWPQIAIRGLRCRFVFDTRRGREGRPATAKLIITNRWPWPVLGLTVSDPLVSGGDDTSLALARVEGWSTATFNCAFTPSQRGVYPNREVRIGTGFPFGLYDATRAANTPRELIVWPQTFWLPPLGGAATRSHWRGGASQVRAGSDGTRLGVREHRLGDSLRDVNWAKTARYDRLIVCERESTTVEDATVIVTTKTADDPTLEWRLRIAASICESFTSNHGCVELWLDGNRHVAGQTPGDLERLMDEIARHQPKETESTALPGGRKASGLVLKIDAEDASIVLRRSGSEAMPSARQACGAEWIRVESLDTVPEQVLRGWRRGSVRRRNLVG